MEDLHGTNWIMLRFQQGQYAFHQRLTGLFLAREHMQVINGMFGIHILMS